MRRLTVMHDLRGTFTENGHIELAGASGRITSMFVADGNGEVRDRELALGFLPEGSSR